MGFCNQICLHLNWHIHTSLFLLRNLLVIYICQENTWYDGSRQQTIELRSRIADSLIRKVVVSVFLKTVRIKVYFNKIEGFGQYFAQYDMILEPGKDEYEMSLQARRLFNILAENNELPEDCFNAIRLSLT